MAGSVEARSKSRCFSQAEKKNLDKATGKVACSTRYSLVGAAELECPLAKQAGSLKMGVSIVEL